MITKSQKVLTYSAYEDTRIKQNIFHVKGMKTSEN